MKYIRDVLLAAIAVVTFNSSSEAQVPVYRYLIGQTHQYHLHSWVRRSATGENSRSYTADADIAVSVTESLDTGDAILSVQMGNLISDYTANVSYTPLTFIPRSQVLISRFGLVRKVWILEDVPKTDGRGYTARRKLTPYRAVMSVLRYILTELPEFSGDSTELHTHSADTTKDGISVSDQISSYSHKDGHFKLTMKTDFTSPAYASKSSRLLEIIPDTGFPIIASSEGEVHEGGHLIEYKIDIARTQ